MSPLLTTFSQLLATLESTKDLIETLSKVQEERRLAVSRYLTSMKKRFILALVVLIAYLIEYVTVKAAVYDIFCGQASIASFYHLIRPTMVAGGSILCYVLYIMIYIIKIYDGASQKTTSMLSQIQETTRSTASHTESPSGVGHPSSSPLVPPPPASITPKQGSKLAIPRTGRMSRRVTRPATSRILPPIARTPSPQTIRASSPMPFDRKERKFTVPTLPDPYANREPTQNMATGQPLDSTRPSPPVLRYESAISVDQYLNSGTSKGKKKVMDAPAGVATSTSGHASSSRVEEGTSQRWGDVVTEVIHAGE